MAKKRTVFLLILLALLVLFDVSWMDAMKSTARLNRLLQAEDTLDKLRAQEVPQELLDKFRGWEKKGGYTDYEYLCAYLLTGEEKKDSLNRSVNQLKEKRNTEFKILTGYLCAVWEDLVYFPVPVSSRNEDAGVTYSDSWMFERTFGGKRGHEGTDIMADINERGRYPVISMTDGVVEKIGWLTKGGYRIGIRAPHGGYFYYAHLFDYAKDFQPGDTVKAGDMLGFMGDSGYSEVEGTVGNFDVHLHLGIYVDQTDGTEISINSYWPLRWLEEKKLTYGFD